MGDLPNVYPGYQKVEGSDAKVKFKKAWCASLDDRRGLTLLEMNPINTESLKLKDGELVKVSSIRGEVTVKVTITDIIPTGVVCMTFHFHETPTNQLTNSVVDPVSKIPETKVCSVNIRKQGVGESGDRI